MTSSHSWHFSRTGGFDQVLLRSSDDLRRLHELDPKLWAALACPVKGLFFDEKTLQLIDVDNDGRVRVPEILAAVQWVCDCLKDPSLILEPGDDIPLSALNEQSAVGASILNSAKIMLEILGKSDSSSITMADVTSQQSALTIAPFNGDGVILEASAAEAELQQLIREIVSAFPGVVDASGKPGVDLPTVGKFYAACAARAEWQAKAQADWSASFDYVAAYSALVAVRHKIDDYFSRCRAAQFDARAVEQLNKPATAWASLSAEALSAECHEFADFPLSMISPKAELDLEAGINPAWQSLMDTFKQSVLKPLDIKESVMTFDAWQALKHQFDAYQAWLNAEAGKEVAALSQERIQAILSGSERAQLEDLIQRDLALKPQVEAFDTIEKLLRFRTHLKVLLNNFVNFSEFYSSDGRAVFEAGTLYLDGRACDLCIDVYDQGKHAALAGLSKCFLAYCDCSRPDGAKKSIVAAFTGGDADYLLVGRNGVFYDREGKDWDATITKLIENPISVRQAFFLPYKKLIRFIEERAAKSASEAENSSQSLLQSTTEKTLTATDPKNPPKPKFDVGVVAALGVAVGGITTALGLLLQSFFGLGWLMPVGLLGLLLLISGPSMFIAWLKLRQRNLGPILDASGWAVNGQVKINVPFGGKLTEVAKLPAGSKRDLLDPYAVKSTPWGRYLIIALVVIGVAIGGWCFATGKCPWFDKTIQSPVPVEAPVELPAES